MGLLWSSNHSVGCKNLWDSLSHTQIAEKWQRQKIAQYIGEGNINLTIVDEIVSDKVLLVDEIKAACVINLRRET